MFDILTPNGTNTLDIVMNVTSMMMMAPIPLIVMLKSVMTMMIVVAPMSSWAAAAQCNILT